jgi:DNA-binding transcriptional LysR family regulator
VARPIGIGRMLLVAAPALLQSLGAPESLADLHRWPALGQGSGPGAVRPWAFVGAGGEPLLHRPQARLVSDSYPALREAALRGAGLIQLPMEACRDAVAAGLLQQVLPALESLPSQAYALYPSRRGMSSALRALLAFIEARYRALD